MKEHPTHRKAKRFTAIAISTEAALHHILATFHVANDVPNPKSNGVRSGYAPHHSFDGIDWLASGFHLYDDEELHFPGESLVARITFPSWDDIRAHVRVGDSFLILELDRIVGHGRIEKIL